MDLRQIDCFNKNITIWKLLAIWPFNFNYNKFNLFYAFIFLSFSIVSYDLLFTVNFYFLPRQLDLFVGELVFYFTVLSVLSKVLTFLCLREKIKKILETLESDIFNPDDEVSVMIIKNAKIFIIRFWKIVAAVSVTANVAHVFIPFILHLCLGIPLELPVCTYSFLSNATIERYSYTLFLYQSVGMHFHMHYNISVDCFIMGLMVLIIAQLRILDAKLRNVTCYRETADNLSEREASLELALNKCIVHYGHISNFCNLVQDVFSIALFIQFGMGSCIICVCLFRFTVPAPAAFYICLAAYMTVMILEIMIPCWFGTRIIVTSSLLSTAIYSCDWPSRSRRFKSSLRLFVERANKPLSLTGGKMFPLSLETFTSIMNSAYSFFTLLRHMQSRDSN